MDRICNNPGNNNFHITCFSRSWEEISGAVRCGWACVAFQGVRAPRRSSLCPAAGGLRAVSITPIATRRSFPRFSCSLPRQTKRFPGGLLIQSGLRPSRASGRWFRSALPLPGKRPLPGRRAIRQGLNFGVRTGSFRSQQFLSSLFWWVCRNGPVMRIGRFHAGSDCSRLTHRFADHYIQ